MGDTNYILEELRPFYDMLKTIFDMFPASIFIPFFILVLYSVFYNVKHVLGGKD